MSMLFDRLLAIVLDPRVIGFAVAAVVAWLLWAHYTGLRDDLVAARSDLATMTTRAETAEQLARDNAAAALKADADRRAVVAALEAAHARLAANGQAARDAETAVRVAPEADDGPVSPLLEALRQRRFR